MKTLKALPMYFMSPDNIEQGKKNNTIELSKRIGNEVFVVQEIRAGRKKLAIITMWKKPLAAHDAPLKESPAETSKTDDKQASSVGSISENKSQAKEEVNAARDTSNDGIYTDRNNLLDQTYRMFKSPANSEVSNKFHKALLLGCLTEVANYIANAR